MRCRFGRYALAVVGVVMLADAAGAEITAAQLESYRRSGGLYTSIDTVKAWDGELAAILKHGTPQAAAAKLAAAHGLSEQQMLALIGFWLAEGDRYRNWVQDAPEKRIAARRAEAAALLDDTRYNNLVLDTATAVLDGEEDCTVESYAALTTKAPDPLATGWHLLSTWQCTAWYGAFIAAHPEKAAAALYIFPGSFNLHKADYLALNDYLLGAKALEHVRAADRNEVLLRQSDEYIRQLWRWGLARDGLKVFEALPVSVRDQLLSGAFAGRDIETDGLITHVGAVDANDTFRLELAAAYLATGRSGEARALFATLKATREAHALVECRFDHAADACKREAATFEKAIGNAGQHKEYRTPSDYGRRALLEHVLNHAGEDSYVLAEVLHNDSLSETRDGIWADVSCLAFDEPGVASLCAEARESGVGNIVYDDVRPSPQAASDHAILQAAIADFESLRAAAKLRLEARIADLGGRSLAGRLGPRASIDPVPSPFAQLPLPVDYRGKPEPRDLSWLKHIAKLPAGYEPVRIERAGSRVVAITVSQNYDPTGEVSPGGFWVHVSDDGGKSWQTPLYTGLSFGFPYVVLPDSKLPLIDGDTLNVAVEIRLLDTASIMYPPIALQSRKHESDLYLKIPLADLRRDSDGDGLTDIAETHLLLDPNNPDSDGDGIPDGVDPMPNVKQAATVTSEQQAVQLLLEKLFSIPSRAIIQTMDHPMDGPEAIVAAATSATKADPNSATRPIFVEGEKADFAGLNPGRMMLVYTPTDIEKLQRMTPDFHAVAFGKIVFNRAHTRGFFSYSFGWSGGTVRLVRVTGGWKLEEISSWIS